MTSPKSTGPASPFPSVLHSRAELDPHDFATVRQLYTEAQQWARHYEGLVVNTNVFIVSAALVFLGLAFNESTQAKIRLLAILIPMVLVSIGLFLTRVLFKLYAESIVRLIRLENLLNCYEEERFGRFDGQGALLPAKLKRLPVAKPVSVKFFLWVHAMLLLVFLMMTLLLWRSS